MIIYSSEDYANMADIDMKVHTTEFIKNMNDREKELFQALLSCGLDKYTSVNLMEEHMAKLLPYKSIKEWVYYEYSCMGMLDVKKTIDTVCSALKAMDIMYKETRKGVLLYSLVSDVSKF